MSLWISVKIFCEFWVIFFVVGEVEMKENQILGCLSWRVGNFLELEFYDIILTTRDITLLSYT